MWRRPTNTEAFMPDFDILCETAIPLSSYEEPDDFVVQYTATIRHDGETIGEVVLYKVLLGLACNYGQNSAEIFDAHSEELLKVYEALFDPDTDDFWEDIEQDFQPCGNDLLIIDSITLDPKWRGLKIGLLALRRLIDLLDGVGSLNQSCQSNSSQAQTSGGTGENAGFIGGVYGGRVHAEPAPATASRGAERTGRVYPKSFRRSEGWISPVGGPGFSHDAASPRRVLVKWHRGVDPE
jgi:hypothetical protein